MYSGSLSGFLLVRSKVTSVQEVCTLLVGKRSDVKHV